jgi:hypothetical protein
MFRLHQSRKCLTRTQYASAWLSAVIDHRSRETAAKSVVHLGELQEGRLSCSTLICLSLSLGCAARRKEKMPHDDVAGFRGRIADFLSAEDVGGSVP